MSSSPPPPFLDALRSSADALRTVDAIEPTDAALAISLCDVIAAALHRASAVPSHTDGPPDPKRLAAARPLALCDLPPELLTRVVALLPSAEDVGRIDCVCRAFHGELRPPTVVEEALRLRAELQGREALLPTPAEVSSGERMAQALLRVERSARSASTIAAGANHSAFVDVEGRLLTCGQEERDEDDEDDEEDDVAPIGLLGHGDMAVVAVPTVVPGLAGVRVHSVAAGDKHTLVLSDQGVAYSFGDGCFGKLGHGDKERQTTPRVIDALVGVRLVAGAVGPGYSLA
eukprot:7381451-Prymnesium_polylepis.1